MVLGIPKRKPLPIKTMQPNPPPPLLPSVVSRNPNPNFDKPMQAIHFLRFLSRLNSTSFSSTTATRRARFIRRASYASMAYVAGPRRVWGRILLRRLRRRMALRTQPICGSRGRSSRMRRAGNTGRSNVLRRLVPGGESLDGCSLLEEAGDFIQCLKAQVKLMQTVVDCFSKGA